MAQMLMHCLSARDEVRQLLEDQGGQITGRGPAEFTAYLRTEIKRWAEIIAVTQIKAE